MISRNNDIEIKNLKVFHFSTEHIKKYGFMDDENKIVINPKYENALDFSEGLAGICTNGKWGFIDTSDILVIACKYDNVCSFHNGFAGVAYRKFDTGMSYIWGFIDKTGKEITQINYEKLNDFSEGFAVVKKSYDEFQFIGENGEVKFLETFCDADSFKNGYAKVSKYSGNVNRYNNKEKQKGAININGEFINEHKFKELTEDKMTDLPDKIISLIGSDNEVDDILDDNVFYFVKKKKKWGIFNKQKHILCQFIFDEIKRVNSDYILVKQGTYKGLIDNNARVQVPIICVEITTPLVDVVQKEYIKTGISDYKVKYELLAYSESHPYITGKSKSLVGIQTKKINLLVLSHQTSTYLYSLSDGYITSREYQSISIICFGYFIVQLNDKFGIINSEGKEILLPEYEEIRYYGGNIVVCQKDGVCGSFNFVLGKMELDMKFEKLIVISNGMNTSEILYASRYIEHYYHILNSKGDRLLDCWDYTKLLYYHPYSEDDREKVEWNSSFLKSLPVCYPFNKILCGNQDDKFGFFDIENFFMIVPFRYTSVSYRDDGYFDICKDNKWGILELKTCKETIACKYDNQIPSFLDTCTYYIGGIDTHCVENINGKKICIVEEDGHYGCIDDCYTEIIPTIYHHIMFEKEKRFIFCGFGGRYDEYNSFSEYVNKATWGCFENTGKCIVPVEYDYIQIFENYLSAGKGWWLFEGQWGCNNGSYNDFEGNCALYSLEGKIILQDYNEIKIAENIIKVIRDIKYKQSSDEYGYNSTEKIGGYYSTYNKEGVLIEDNIPIEGNNSYFVKDADYGNDNNDWERETWDALTDGQYGDYPEDGYNVSDLLDSMGRG